MKRLRKCLKCKIYTFKLVCPNCNNKTVLAYPPKYSPADKYGEYRRKIKYGLKNGNQNS